MDANSDGMMNHKIDCQCFVCKAKRDEIFWTEERRIQQSISRIKFMKNHPDIQSGQNNPMYGKKNPGLVERNKSRIGQRCPWVSDRNRVNSGSKHPFFGKKRPEHSIMMRGINNPNFGKPSSLRGRTRSKEIRRKISFSLRGDKHPNWKGGISHQEYSENFNKELKFYIRNRDNFCCCFCGKTENGKGHDIHHIDYNKKNDDPKNLITLCAKHHAETNYHRNKWELCFTILQEIKSCCLTT